ncbi:MAG: CPBP family glutamic-type intramembrane protease [Candidatus Omnitrophota bacterium]|nr:CPBP family glutamic-type intramembrane protease [Candidatus Omnitrophota bacterium]
MDLVILIILCIMFVEMRLLKREDQARSREVFSLPANLHWLLALIIILSLFAFQDKTDAFAFFVLAALVPLYRIRRSRFWLQARQRNVWEGREDPPVSLLTSEALGVLLLWLYSSFILSLVIKTISNAFPDAISDLGDVVISTSFSYIIILALVYRLSRRYSSQGFRPFVGLSRQHQPLFKLIVLPLVLGLGFAFFSAFILVTRQVQPVTPLGEMLDNSQSITVLVLFVGLAILIAPLIEEIVFRGYLFSVIEKINGKRMAIYCVAAIFALMHVGQYWGDWAAIAVVAILGLALSLLRAWTGSTIATSVMHYVYNTGVTVLPIILILLANPPYFEYVMGHTQLDAPAKERLLKESIGRQPQWSEAYNDLAWLYAQENKNLEEALELIDKALALSPDEYAFLDTKAEILAKLQRWPEATALRETLLTSAPSGEQADYQRQKLEDIKNQSL